MPFGLAEHGQRYWVTCAGETLAEGRRNPIFYACRALLARGITDRLEVWRPGKISADMSAIHFSPNARNEIDIRIRNTPTTKRQRCIPPVTFNMLFPAPSSAVNI
jgi:hypothetical protein